MKVFFNYSVLFCLFIVFSCQSKQQQEIEKTIKALDIKQKEFYTGDVIFQTSLSNQSKAIQLATKSIYSHVGMIVEKNKQYYVFEAAAKVKYTPLDEWIKRGKGGKYVVKRLKGDILGKELQRHLTRECKSYEGKSYDLLFEWSDDKQYCSELVWKIYEGALNIELSPLSELRDFDLTHAAVKEKLKQRYGNNIPLDEKVVSPDDLFQSEALVDVKAN